jgi:hypothetical protein
LNEKSDYTINSINALLKQSEDFVFSSNITYSSLRRLVDKVMKINFNMNAPIMNNFMPMIPVVNNIEMPMVVEKKEASPVKEE